MQNALGVFQQDCQNLRYEDNNLVLEIQTPKEKLCCPVCGSHNINRNGSHIRRFVSVPIGLSKTYLDMRVHRIQCHDSASASSKTKCNKRVSLSERYRRSRRVERSCLPLSERKKKQPAIQIKKGDRSLPKIN